ncbi:fibroblast growth factor 21, partial [Chanos chanos]|uniref:Fibroblast growth factor n=1 Tax=Chanos chanos TaxID=29144 RepID=A0A6J2WJC9_CHACN
LPSNDLPFSDQVRQRHLYTESRRQGLFLEITPEGTVMGSPLLTKNSVLELRSVKAGQTVIRGVATALFLCVNHAGHLRGQHMHTQLDCTFQELLLANGYTLFLSPHTGLPVSLPSKLSGERRGHSLSRFLPVRSSLCGGAGIEEEDQGGDLRQSWEYMNLDSDDPFGVGPLGNTQSLFSPGLHM